MLLLNNMLRTHSIVEDCMYLLPPANEVWGKVMFSQVFVCPMGGGGRVSVPACITGGFFTKVMNSKLRISYFSFQKYLE